MSIPYVYDRDINPRSSLITHAPFRRRKKEKEN
jgi:hypothetical protein